MVGVGRPGGFVLGGGTHPDGGVRANGAHPVDPLSDGDRWRRRCPARGPGQRTSSALYKELSASANAKPKGVPLRAYRGDRLALGQGGPVADGPVLYAAVASDAPGQRDQPP